MITKEQKASIVTQFQEKYPNIYLKSWEDSHHKIPKIINEKKYEIGIEIGCAFGHHLETILTETNIKKLYGIDPYMPYKDYEKDTMYNTWETMNDYYEFVKNNLSYYADRFELIRDFSDNAVSKFQDNSLDFIYIDGNHTEEYVKRDLKNWWPKVKDGGILSGHDYDHIVFLELTVAVNDFFRDLKKEVINMGNHVWVVYK